jgi:nicotinamide mononucleotide transporter
MGKKIQFGHILMLFGILSQVLTYIITKDSLLSFISGLTGVFAVVLCSKRRMSYYVFSILQMITFFIICLHENLYGKLFEQVFYFVTTIFGIFIWRNNLDNDKSVKPKKLSVNGIQICITSFIIGFGLFSSILLLLGGNNIVLDAITTTLAIMAQVLMILRYRENWILWFIVDVLCVFLFLIQEDYCMMTQYIFWTINTIYGFVLWKNNT